MNKIEHIGIAIKSAEVSVPLFNKLYNTEPYKIEIVESEKVNWVSYHFAEDPRREEQEDYQPLLKAFDFLNFPIPEP